MFQKGGRKLDHSDIYYVEEVYHLLTQDVVQDSIWLSLSKLVKNKMILWRYFICLEISMHKLFYTFLLWWYRKFSNTFSIVHVFCGSVRMFLWIGWAFLVHFLIPLFCMHINLEIFIQVTKSLQSIWMACGWTLRKEHNKRLYGHT